MFAKVNMANIGMMFVGVVIQFCSNVAVILKGQPVSGCARFLCSFFIISFIIQVDAIVDNGRQRFQCHPETNVVHKEQCFARYSAEMSPLIRPNQFLWVTSLTLVVFWTFMIQYSRIHLPKIIRETAGSNQRERLCHQYWTMFLLHVGIEAVVLSVLSGLFFYNQKFVFAETFNCTLMIAPVMTCIDMDHLDKPFLYSFILIWLMLTSLVGYLTFFYQICYKENFLKELLAEIGAGDGANNFTNAQSSGFTNTGNPNQQQDDGANNFTNDQSSGSTGFTNTGNPNQQQDDGANNFTNDRSSGFTNMGNPNQQQDDSANNFTNDQSSGSSGFTNTSNPNQQQGSALDVTSTMSSATLIPSGFASSSNGIRHRKAGGGSDNPKKQIKPCNIQG